MGACVDSRTDREKEVDDQVHLDAKKAEEIYKLLFLGSGDSGKSTIFKQLRKIHGDGYNDVYRRSFIPPIHNQILSEMQHAIELIDVLRTDYPQKYASDNSFGISDSKEARDNVALLSMATRLLPEVASAIQYLWTREPVIKTIFSMRSTLKLSDTTEYFWNDIDRIVHRSYVPTDDDLVLVRNPTTGLYQQTIDIDGYSFQIVDVGGQRTERRKWIHQFEQVTAVIFIASLSCFDAVLYEDDDINAMKEQLVLFDEICNNEYFVKTSMILLLNKRDLFELKIVEDPKNINIRNVWPEYTGDVSNFDDCAAFIKKEFEILNRHPNRTVFVHFCCATDTNNVKKIFNDIQHIIVTESLSQAGLISQ